MSKFARAVDRTHAEVRDTLRKIPGVAVRDVSRHSGLGCDLLVTLRGRDTWFVEVKDGALSPSRRKLSGPEEALERQVGARFAVVFTAKGASDWVCEELKNQSLRCETCGGEVGRWRDLYFAAVDGWRELALTSARVALRLPSNYEKEKLELEAKLPSDFNKWAGL